MAKTAVFFASIVLAAFFITSSEAAQAADFRLSPNSAIRIAESGRDLYLLGRKIEISYEVEGDVIAFSQTDFTLNKPITDSLFAIGATATLKDKVGRHGRIFSPRVFWESEIGGDALIACGELYATGQAKSAGDFFAACRQISFEGEVGGKTLLRGGAIRLGGIFMGDVEISADKLEILEETEIKGTLNYSSPEKATIAPSAKIEGETNFNQIKKPRTKLEGLFSAEGAIRFVQSVVAVAIFALLLLYILKSLTDQTIQVAITSPFKSAIAGVVFAFGAPLAVLILLASLIGAGIGATVALFYVVAFIFGYVFGAIYLGEIFAKIFNRPRIRENVFALSLVGAILIVLSGYIPYIGSWIKLIVIIITTGALIKVCAAKIKTDKAAK